MVRLIDDGAINGIKVGLMGRWPVSVTRFFWGTVRPVFAALGAGDCHDRQPARTITVLLPV